MAHEAVLQIQHIQYHLNLCASDIDPCDLWKNNQFHSILRGYLCKRKKYIIFVYIDMYSIIIFHQNN